MSKKRDILSYYIKYFDKNKPQVLFKTVFRTKMTYSYIDH